MIGKNKWSWFNKPWIKKFGIATFLFFLIKGLVWIAIGLCAYLSFWE
ncbi:MAG: hypothetical protein LC117_02295 [Bacteroidia bacterium]|nr:hypothetical protein [Bacteroidia bacterium]MCZ2276744.1 hypothetical protein [Bacteroidia bacterium]